MFYVLFKKQTTLEKHEQGAFSKERKDYLSYCSKQGTPWHTLRMLAAKLLIISQELNLSKTCKVSSAVFFDILEINVQNIVSSLI